jgi:hypothetical protein
MKPTHLFSLLVLAQFVASCPCLGDDGSARRYAELLGNDELFLTFSLLERGDVQHELKMTAKQVAIVKQAYTAREIPGMTEFLANSRKRQSDPTLSAVDRVKMGKAVHAEFRSRIEAFQRKELSAALSAIQRQRLDELLTQMRGPIAILDNPAISSKLRLSERQRAEMQDTVKHYEAGLGWLRARYGRQQISGLHVNETLEDRQKEVEALFVVIHAIEKGRDADLLVGLRLTPDQLASWRKIQGKPFPIAWTPTSVSDFPFEEKK